MLNKLFRMYSVYKLYISRCYIPWVVGMTRRMWEVSRMMVGIHWKGLET